MPPSADEFDDIPDTFDDADWDALAVAETAATTATVPTHPPPTSRQPPAAANPEFVQGSSTGPNVVQDTTPASSQSFGFDEFDDAEFAAADTIEAALTQRPSAPHPPILARQCLTLYRIVARLPLVSHISTPRTPTRHAVATGTSRKSAIVVSASPSPCRPSKRPRTSSTPPSTPGKNKKPSCCSEKVRAALEGYDEELTCPMYVSYFHLGWLDPAY